jgi:hypothetical protein
MSLMITNEITADLSKPGYISLTVNDQPGPQIELLEVFKVMINASVTAYDGRWLSQWEDVCMQLAEMCREKADSVRGPLGVPCKL